MAGEPDGREPLAKKNRRRWEDNIKVYLRETGWEIMHWIHLAQYRVHWWVPVNTVMNLRVP
jgi:hypothetical protein